MQDDMAQLRDYVGTQSGLEVTMKSPLARALETARIDRSLKTSSLDRFDGSSYPSEFLNTFDRRMAFYGHSEVAHCNFSLHAYKARLSDGTIIFHLDPMTLG